MVFKLAVKLLNDETKNVMISLKSALLCMYAQSHRSAMNPPPPNLYTRLPVFYRPFSALNLSQLSFSVLNTVSAMSLTSVDASCGSYNPR